MSEINFLICNVSITFILQIGVAVWSYRKFQVPRNSPLSAFGAWLLLGVIIQLGLGKCSGSQELVYFAIALIIYLFTLFRKHSLVERFLLLTLFSISTLGICIHHYNVSKLKGFSHGSYLGCSSQESFVNSFQNSQSLLITRIVSKEAVKNLKPGFASDVLRSEFLKNKVSLEEFSIIILTYQRLWHTTITGIFKVTDETKMCSWIDDVETLRVSLKPCISN